MNVDIIGTGFVGLTLGIALSNSGLKVTCWDIDKNKIENLKRGITDIKEPFIKKLIIKNINNKNLQFKISGEDEFSEFVIISVGTQLIDSSSESSTSNLFKIVSALAESNKIKYVVLRCTVSVGLTRRLNNKWGEKIHFIYAPERTIEGNAINELNELPQIISCKDDSAKREATKCFSKLNVPLLFSDKWEEAELAKLLCNVYRDYIFAFSNQAALICRNLSIDLSTVSELASSEYKRFPKLKPGPVSGPCLTKDTIILSESFKEKKVADLYLKARKTNILIEDAILEDIFLLVNKFKIKSILMNGLSFKSNPPVGDTRDSHAVRIASKIIDSGIEFFYFDDIVDDSGKELFKDYVYDQKNNNIDLLIFPIIPHWYPNQNVIIDKFKFKPRYWFYKPNILLEDGMDYFFGDYKKI